MYKLFVTIVLISGLLASCSMDASSLNVGETEVVIPEELKAEVLSDNAFFIKEKGIVYVLSNEEYEDYKEDVLAQKLPGMRLLEDERSSDSDSECLKWSLNDISYYFLFKEKNTMYLLETDQKDIRPEELKIQIKD